MWRALLAEAAGTFLMVFLGIGAVHASVLTNAQMGVWQVAVVWAIGVALGIYVSSAWSGAHLNPALTAAFALYAGFPKARVVPYWMSQFAGAYAAAAVLYVVFQGPLTQFESAHGLTRGSPGSERSAMCYGEYFPNPAMASPGDVKSDVGMLEAAAAEFAGTAILAFVVFSLTRQLSRRGAYLTPLVIGLTVAGLISVLSPISQAGFNPARDFGPRVFSYFAGWGSIAIPGPRGGFFVVYILAPILGACAGAWSNVAMFSRKHTP